MKTLQGTIDLIILRTLASLEPQHAYGIAARLLQVSDSLYSVNQGPLYPALVRLEQQKLISGRRGKTDSAREAKYYTMTRSRHKALSEETLCSRAWAGAM